MAFVNASHATNKKTHKLHKGYVIFINCAPVIWYRKRQQTVESSTFSSEFMAMKTCTEMIQHLHFKLGMFRVPLPQGELAQVYCDSESVVNNSTKIESKFNKKHSSMAYHYVQWCVAAGIITITWIDSKENISDAFTKQLSMEARNYLFDN
jgi:hypothetical protein